LLVTHVRQALQQTVACGAMSPYRLAAWTMRPVQICFTPESLPPPRRDE
jgi:hypothetical protein